MIMSNVKSPALLLAGFLFVAMPLTLPAYASEEAAVQIPATTTSIWEAIDQRTVMLEKAIQSGVLDEVHHHAFAIRDLTAALADHSSSLSPSQRGKLQNNIKFIKVLAQRLDESGDNNDRAGAEANLSKLKGVLNSVRVLYSSNGGR